MKIAIPVKTNKENPPVAPLFGKAKWFAFVEDGNITIEKNPAQGGQGVVGWLAEQKIEAIIFQEMGASPYEIIKAHRGTKLYHSGYERILLDDLLQKFGDNAFTELNDAKMTEIIGHHERKR